jgi:Rab-GTPase-TBC domain
MSRLGIPPALRCALWISSVVKACHPHQPPEYSNNYRTLEKVRQIDYAWESVLKQLFPNPGDEVNNVASPPTFGNTSYKDYIGGPLPDYGEKCVTRVLLALHYVVGLEYAPLLPTLAIVSLSFMSESYAYSMLREMAHNSTCYFPTSPLEHVAWCRAFMDVLQRLHPQTAICLRKCHLEGSSGKYEGLDPIFKLFFFPVLKFVHVLRIMDIYVLEGSKVIFRFGVALLCMFKKDWKVRCSHSIVVALSLLLLWTLYLVFSLIPI